MPPKKSIPVPGKKKKTSPENGGELDIESKAKLYQFTCDSLRFQLAERSEAASIATTEQIQMKERLTVLTDECEKVKQDNLELTQQMTRQYKGMQQELLARINKLEDTICQLRDKLSGAEARQLNIIKEKDVIISDRENDIDELKMRMDAMADEFSRMLKETLDKMKERMEASTTNFDLLDFNHRINFNVTSNTNSNTSISAQIEKTS